ncbi:MAG: radical SAM protein [Candidatus Altiarchaeales archaeon]|nr:MAG: radical SAM protein [Candidatus Altiarchaeales archaeon]RLI96043.1 MAG: radical SAM protein [Candidatus Altiarchaeales archaeon]RLI96052.1 MAG: radical SAM protein [Candidatus Altiarchaeales archaeon]
MKEQIRVSIGTLRVLGMELLVTDADPTTAYLQTYHPGKCLANCKFCAQARDSLAKNENIARGVYPARDTKEVISRLSKAYEHGLLKRACIQTMNYPCMFSDLIYLISEIKKISEIPISVSIYPFPRERFVELKERDIDKLVIPLDAVTEKIFDEIKGKKANCPYRWQGHMKALNDAVDLFGKYSVGTHLILGLGETEEEAVGTIQMLRDMGVYSALFAYTPILHAQLQRDAPEIGHYRRIQIAHYLIEKGLSSFNKMKFEHGKIVDFGVDQKILDKAINSGEPFLTKGCPNCNRPYSTEAPGGLIYNYPRTLTDDEIGVVRSQLEERYHERDNIAKGRRTL